MCACSTCHVILEEEVFDSLDDPSEEEEDMLDQAFGLTPTSRLGCQVELTETMDGIKASQRFFGVVGVFSDGVVVEGREAFSTGNGARRPCTLFLSKFTHNYRLSCRRRREISTWMYEGVPI